MKKLHSCFLILALFTFSCKNVQNSRQVNNSSLKKYLSYPLDENQGFISVHRGGGELEGNPENCLESFAFFNEQFPCFIECDVATTADGEQVMMHDETVDRTTNGSGKVSDLSSQEIAKLKLKDNSGKLTNYAVPTLLEVLKWSKDKAILTLDLKKSTPFQSVISLVEQTKSERNTVIITYSANEALDVYRLNPNLKISVGIMQKADYERLATLGIPDENMIAFIGTREPKKELITFLHEKGIATILGTLGNLDKKALTSNQNLFQKWQKMGVDIFATDYPLEAYEKLKL